MAETELKTACNVCGQLAPPCHVRINGKVMTTARINNIGATVIFVASFLSGILIGSVT